VDKKQLGLDYSFPRCLLVSNIYILKIFLYTAPQPVLDQSNHTSAAA